ncbi:MAG TPA: D-alanyl-D-alanine carboxypeptidase/D-alanyl-D-alanine-endopeptidase, partial [Planctomycetota bacterium]|nr:D-alanyl-D-alanine carboxypeptidase/D-alanyl-D-alanine-endopeptidase [Planctomycetota bacterium]
GDLVADDTLFDRQYTCPSWPAAQLHKWYAAPVAGLSFNDNCLDIVISPTTSGRPVRLTLHPDTRYFTVTNQLITTSSAAAARKQGFFLSRALGTNHVILKGGWPAGAAPERKFVTVNEPPLYFGTVVAEEMRRAGITLGGTVRLARRAGHFVGPKDPRVHIIHTSSLRDTIRVMNKRSQSFYAEQLLKRTGAAFQGHGTYATGAAAASAYLKTIGVPPGSYVMADGGGLSRASRFTPQQFATVLTHAYNAPYGRMFVDSLSRSGIDKSMQKRLGTPAYRGRIAGKTGTLDGVVTLSGYAFNRHGHVLAFSILVNNSHNNWTARAFTDDICRILIDEKLP